MTYQEECARRSAAEIGESRRKSPAESTTGRLLWSRVAAQCGQRQADRGRRPPSAALDPGRPLYGAARSARAELVPRGDPIVRLALAGAVAFMTAAVGPDARNQ